MFPTFLTYKFDKKRSDNSDDDGSRGLSRLLLGDMGVADLAPDSSPADLGKIEDIKKQARV